MKRFLLFCFGLLVFANSAGAEILDVLSIVSDDLKASVPGCYGDKVCATPNIDRLATQGVVFEPAYCQGTVCGLAGVAVPDSAQGKSLVPVLQDRFR